MNGKTKRIPRWIREEFFGWSPWEIAWFFIATAVIVSLSLFWHDSVIAIFSSLTGVWCVILTGKGKLSSFFVGLINSVLYAYIAFGAKYYGDVMLNLFYYVPTGVIGICCWTKNMNRETGEVLKKKLTGKQSIALYLFSALAVGIYGGILSLLGGSLPLVDSTSTVLSIVAQILCIKRYAEQWVIWIAVNTVTVVMWIFAFFRGTESVATLLMWVIYLLNAIFMWVKWRREAKNAL